MRRKSPFPYVKPVRRRGRIYFYFERQGFERVRLPGAWGSAEFQEAYKAALAGETAPPVEIGAERTKAGSVSAAIALYLDSGKFRDLAPDTKRGRRVILDRFRERFGELPIKGMKPERIEAILAEKTSKHSALSLFKALRAVTLAAKKAHLIESDPLIGVDKPRVPQTDGFQTWSEDQIAQFEAFYPIGTRARLAFALLLFTGQRRSDVVRMGRQHVKGRFIAVRRQKTGTALEIPLHPELQEILTAHPVEHLTFLTTQAGQPFTAGGFSHWFVRVCRAAGLPSGLSAHGLRKAMCRRLAEAGCSANQIAAISGHARLQEVTRYTKDADQKRMAESAMASIDGTKGVSNPKTSKPNRKTIAQLIEKK